MVFSTSGVSAETLTVAYFSMEFGIDPAMPTYSGGLGILAGDTIRAAADLGLPMVGVTLLHRRGYFQQHLDEHGNQSETVTATRPDKYRRASSICPCLALLGMW